MTRIDLIVGAFVGAMLFTGLLAADQAADEQARRTACAANLARLHRSLVVYANENKGRFPLTRHDPAKADSVAFYTGVKAREPFQAGGPEMNDVTAAMYLLLRTTQLDPAVFLCPSAEAAAAATDGATRLVPVAGNPELMSNFPSAANLSYSYPNPYASAEVIKKGFKLTGSLTSDFPLMADMNPGGHEVARVKAGQMPPTAPAYFERQPPPPATVKLDDMSRRANSRNHAGDGQNVLYSDGRVYFHPTPFCGMPRPVPGGASPRENIYTRHMAGAVSPPAKPGSPSPGVATGNPDPIVGPPMDQYDAVLLPVAPAEKPRDAAAAAPRPAEGDKDGLD